MFDLKRIGAAVDRIVNKQSSRSDFSSRMAAGRAKAAASRASSTAPPSAPVKAKVATPKAIQAVKPPKTSLPKPAKAAGVTVPKSDVGPGPGGGHTINIRIGK